MLYPLLLGLLAFELTPFTNSFLWALPAHLCLLSTSYNSHGLTTSLYGAPLGLFTFFGALLLFCKPVYHYSCHLVVMVFLTLLIFLSLPHVILLGFFLPLNLFFLPKWASTISNNYIIYKVFFFLIYKLCINIKISQQKFKKIPSVLY